MTANAAGCRRAARAVRAGSWCCVQPRPTSALTAARRPPLSVGLDRDRDGSGAVRASRPRPRPCSRFTVYRTRRLCTSTTRRTVRRRPWPASSDRRRTWVRPASRRHVHRLEVVAPRRPPRAVSGRASTTTAPSAPPLVVGLAQRGLMSSTRRGSWRCRSGCEEVRLVALLDARRSGSVLRASARAVLLERLGCATPSADHARHAPPRPRRSRGSAAGAATSWAVRPSDQHPARPAQGPSAGGRWPRRRTCGPVEVSRSARPRTWGRLGSGVASCEDMLSRTIRRP